MSLHKWRIVFVAGLFLSLLSIFRSFQRFLSPTRIVCYDKMASRRNQIQNTQYLILISLTEWNYQRGVIFFFLSLCIVCTSIPYPMMGKCDFIQNNAASYFFSHLFY